MGNLDVLFRENQHYLTIRNREGKFPKRFLVKKPRQLKSAISKQNVADDLFVTKYAKDRCVDTIILDFDSEDKKLAYKEVNKLRNYLKTNGINSAIVDSTNKGFHCYIQVPFRPFCLESLSKKDNNKLFNDFVSNLINQSEFGFETLDKVNSSAGLGGNIRLVGSIHPTTGKKVKIIKGKIKRQDNDYIMETLDFANKIYLESYNLFKIKLKDEQKKVEKYRKESIKKYGRKANPIESNDLREIMPRLFGGKSKLYDNGYVYMTCPFHNDSNPSLLVTKEFYSCSACGSKGNIWTLHKKGYIDLFNMSK